MYDLLRSNTKKYLELSDEEFDYYFSLFEVKHFKKKEFLLKQGDVCNFEAYVLSGAISGFHTDEDGQNTVLDLMFEDWWVTDIYGMAVQRPSFLNFQAHEDTKVLQITRQQKEELYHKFPIFDRLYRLMGMVKVGSMQKRIISNLKQTADERYLQFIRKYPNIEKRFPQYMIASYLGISAEFMSKIRKKVKAT